MGVGPFDREWRRGRREAAPGATCLVGVLPVGSVVWLFDQTDMFAAKRALGGRAAIAGNVPTALLALATPGEVEKYVTDLLDACARDGGVLLQNGAVLDDAKAENLKTMIETARNWKG